VLSKLQNTPRQAFATLLLAALLIYAFSALVFATTASNWLTLALILPIALTVTVFAFLAYRRS